jgi:hypothetical protein
MIVVKARTGMGCYSICSESSEVELVTARSEPVLLDVVPWLMLGLGVGFSIWQLHRGHDRGYTFPITAECTVPHSVPMLERRRSSKTGNKKTSQPRWLRSRHISHFQAHFISGPQSAMNLSTSAPKEIADQWAPSVSPPFLSPVVKQLASLRRGYHISCQTR